MVKKVVLNTRVTEETLRRIKAQAALSGRSLLEVVEEALEDWLSVVEKEEAQA